MPKSAFSPAYQHFRHLIISRRKRYGKSQEEVAAILTKPQSFVSKYEQGERRLDVIEFLEVAAAIGFDPREFIVELLRLVKPGSDQAER